MSYVKTTWQDGDVITTEKLNNIESGIESSLSNELLALYKTMASKDWPYDPTPTDAEVIDKIAADAQSGGGEEPILLVNTQMPKQFDKDLSVTDFANSIAQYGMTYYTFDSMAFAGPGFSKLTYGARDKLVFKYEEATRTVTFVSFTPNS